LGAGFLSLKAERRRMIRNIGGLGELRRFAPFKSCGGSASTLIA
jgi:hypothetical protein